MFRCTLFSLAITSLIIGCHPLKMQDAVDVTIPELTEHMQFLASDSLKGRKPGTKEDFIAANYIRRDFLKNKLVPLFDNGLQIFEFVTSIKPGTQNQLTFNGFTGELLQDFTPLSFSANTSLSAPVAFCGFGFDIATDSLTWKDYEGIDIAGKWVLIFLGDPESDRSNSVFEAFSSVRKKVLVAKDHGAAGVLFVNSEKFDKDDTLLDLIYEQSQTSTDLPVLQIKRHVADLFFQHTTNRLADLEGQLVSSRRPNSFDLEVTLNATVDLVKTKAKTHNVAALLPGGDLTLKEECIVLGAHYDHLGFGGPKSGSRRPDTLAIHNGADDNASGVAAVLEIIEKLAANRKTLKRSILVVAFAAEEMGTLGSKYFTEHPPIALNNMKYMFNLDMVGRLNPETRGISLSGTGTALGLSDMAENLAKNHGFTPALAPEGLGPSDHASFYIKDIPVLSFMTSIHDDYHTPDDDADKINYVGQKMVADLVHDLIVELGNRQDVLAFQEAGPKSQPSMRRRFKVSLRIMPNVTGSTEKGVRVDGITPDGPASRAGMHKGDVIVAMEGKPVNDIYEYMARLADFRSGQRISVDVMRNDEKVVLIVEL